MTRTLRGWAIHGVALAAALCAAGRPGVAGAHEFWLSPSSYRQTKGDTLEIAASLLSYSVFDDTLPSRHFQRYIQLIFGKSQDQGGGRNRGKAD